MTKALGPDTPGLYGFDMDTIAQAEKIKNATNREVRAELVAPFAKAASLVEGADWAVVTGIAAGNTAELLRIIRHMADQLAASEARVEELRGQLRDKATECGGLRGQLRIAQAGQASA